MNPSSGQPSTSSISLPPISSMDPYRQQAVHSPMEYQQQQQPHRHLPVPYPAMGAMSRHDVLPSRPIYSGVVPPYQIPPGRVVLPPSSDPNLMIAGRIHKTKEVKRRTKTGCMTCRKRRIKCDEARPTCKNCQKSKRDCLGYDPAYLGQPDSPSNIQSAPIANSARTSLSSSTLPHTYSAHQASSPSVSSQAPSVLTESSEQLEYQHHHHYRPSYEMEGPHPDYSTRHSIRRATQKSTDALCTIGNNERPILPPLPSDPPNKDALNMVYSTAFATGLDTFLETRWYSQHGFEALLSDRELLAQFLAYITFVQNRQPSANQDALASQELRVVWGLMQLVHKSGSGIVQTNESRDIAGLLQAFEILLTGTPVPTDGLQHVQFSTAPSSVLQQQLARRKQEFWAAFTSFVVLLHKADFNLDASLGCERELEKCRSRLDTLENRDIIYSIMVMHYLGRRDELGFDRDPSSPSHAFEAMDSPDGVSHGTGDHIHRRHGDWTTSCQFLQREAGGRATNVVYSNVAAMALRAWD